MNLTQCPYRNCPPARSSSAKFLRLKGRPKDLRWNTPSLGKQQNGAAIGSQENQAAESVLKKAVIKALLDVDETNATRHPLSLALSSPMTKKMWLTKPSVKFQFSIIVEDCQPSRTSPGRAQLKFPRCLHSTDKCYTVRWLDLVWFHGSPTSPLAAVFYVCITLNRILLQHSLYFLSSRRILHYVYSHVSPLFTKNRWNGKKIIATVDPDKAVLLNWWRMIYYT